MSNTNMERMKKLIEEKKKVSAQQGYKKVVEEKQSVETRKAFRNQKSGGLFDR